MLLRGSFRANKGKYTRLASHFPDLNQRSTLGGGDLPPAPPEAPLTLLAGSPLAAKAGQGDQL